MVNFGMEKIMIKTTKHIGSKRLKKIEKRDLKNDNLPRQMDWISLNFWSNDEKIFKLLFRWSRRCYLQDWLRRVIYY